MKAPLLQLSRKPLRRPHPFRLQQMPSLMPADNHQSRSNREPNHRDKRIAKPNLVHVVFSRPSNHFPCRVVARQKSLQYGSLHPRTRHDLLRCRSLLLLCRRLNETFDKPPAKQSRRDFLHWLFRFSFKSPRNRRQIHFVRYAEMFQALPDAPPAIRRLPI